MFEKVVYIVCVVKIPLENESKSDWKPANLFRNGANFEFSINFNKKKLVGDSTSFLYSPKKEFSPRISCLRKRSAFNKVTLSKLLLFLLLQPGVFERFKPASRIILLKRFV